jgi:hypothetical protein
VLLVEALESRGMGAERVQEARTALGATLDNDRTGDGALSDSEAAVRR